ncbi:hypothetical protein [Isachenkonia alkalipeptolytica]|uniref:Uncharacterized protein n=1 Tax=Isachenkonia alkalipeptolytica TaxID=2565777 RepID=A0AA43XP07_9CLOT|nr:hypothetical protein [Isachenkonia alkalipeptolytica]NBG89664.1 hypothetical protein [Isachenkonia alkalipeptolytica]
MKDRLLKLEAKLKPRVKAITFNDTRRKGLELYRRITAGEHIPKPPELSEHDKEMRRELMKKLDKVRGQ